jgi:hypothetical protein
MYGTFVFFLRISFASVYNQNSLQNVTLCINIYLLSSEAENNLSGDEEMDVAVQTARTLFKISVKLS